MLLNDRLPNEAKWLLSISDRWESVSSKKIVLVPVFLTNTTESSNFKKSMLQRPPRHLLKGLCCYAVQVEETRAVSARPTQEFTKFRFWSSCLGDDLNVTRVRCPSSCFMKTLCLESTLHTMLSSPIRACIRNNRWTAGILSILQLTGSNHVQWWAAGVVIWCRKTQVSDGWTRKAGREWHQSQHLSSEHSDLFLLDFSAEAFSNTCIVTCLAHTAAKVPGSEFCNIQLALSPHSTLILIPYTVRVSGCFRQ